MEQNLIVDIQRNLEIMGISEQVDLISVQTPLPQFLRKLGINVEGRTITTLDDFNKEIERGLLNDGAGRLTNIFRKTINYLAKKKVLSEEERIFLSSICRRYFSKYLENLYANVERDIIRKVGPNMWEKLKKQVILDESRTTEEIYNILRKPEYMGPNLTLESTQILRDMVRNKPTSLSIPTSIPANKFTPAEQNIIKAERDWESVTEWNTEQLDKLIKSNQGFGAAYKAIVEEILNIFRSRMKILNETQSLIKTWETSPGARTDDLLNKIGQNLLVLARRNKTDYQIIKSWVERTVPASSSIYDNHFKKAILSNDYAKLAEAVFTGKAKEEWIKQNGTYWQRFSKAGSQFRAFVLEVLKFPFIQIAKIFKKDYESKLKKYFTNAEYAPFRRKFWTGRTLPWSELGKYMKTFGLTKTAVLMGKNFIVALIWVQFWWGVMKLFYDAVLGAFLGLDKKALERYERLVDSESIKKIAEKYDLGSDTIGGIIRIFGVLGSYTIDGAKHLEYYVPGLADDMIKMTVAMADRLIFLTKDKIQSLKQTQIEIQNTIDSTGVQIQNRLDSLERRANIPDSAATNLGMDDVRIPGTLEVVSNYVKQDPRIKMSNPVFTPTEDGYMKYLACDGDFCVYIIMASDGKSVKTWEPFKSSDIEN